MKNYKQRPLDLAQRLKLAHETYAYEKLGINP